MLTAAPATSSPAEPGDGATPLDIPAPAAPDLERAKISPSLDLDATEQQTVFVQLEGAGAADVAAQGSLRGVTPKRRAENRRAEVQNDAESVVDTATAADPSAVEVYTVSNAVPGVAVSTDAAGIAAIAERDDVVRVSRVTRHTIDNANTAGLLRANNVWSASANTGEGVKIGIIDTGIDYTHATFGGAGTVEAFEAAAATSTEPGWAEGLPALGQAKVVGGYDFAGDDYNADPTSPDYSPVPVPDDNPLDCEGHGTHVAGSAGGYGVLPDGSTFAGNYANVGPNTLRGLKIGPGMAPKAELYGLRVFGCGGSTDQTIAALDWALDPNGDGDFSDKLDIVNMSLGSSYAPTDDPQNDVVDALTRHGVLTVASAGNEGDLTDAGGSPGSATSALTVASSVDSQERRDAVRVTAPSNVAGTALGQFSQAYDYLNNGPTGAPVSGAVAALPGANADGCTALTPEEAALVAGKVAWLEWDDVDATRRCGSVARADNLTEAGAVGAIFTSNLDVFAAGISGNAAIPVIQLTGSETARLRPLVAAGTLTVEFDGALAQSVSTYNNGITDTISGFTSRGGHGSYNGVKPDVAAPGDTISSAAVGSGAGSATLSGTSMAAPVTAGVAALVMAQNPSWAPLEVKAAMMNTATNDLFAGLNRTGSRYGPARVGAGRIDARSATTATTLAYTTGENNPVSATFGVVNAPVTTAKVTKQKTITVRNLSSQSRTYAVAYEPITSQPGVAYTVSTSSVTVPARSTRTVTLNMVVYPNRLARVIDPTMQTNQVGAPRQYVSAASGRVTIKQGTTPAVRVPVYGTARANSTTTSAVQGDQLVLSGAGVNQGNDPAARQRSLVSVLELGARSGQLPVCTGGAVSGCVDQDSDRGQDLQHVGAGADDDYLWFGIDTWGDWATVGRINIPFVDFDVDGDGAPDYEVYLQFFADTDVLYAVTVDLNTGEEVDAQPVNFFDANVDTNVFDTDVVLLPVLKESVGLPSDGSSAPITYVAGIADAFAGGTADATGAIEFDAGTPAVATQGPLFVDTNGATIDLVGTGGADALVLHLYGAPGRRGEVVTVPGGAS